MAIEGTQVGSGYIEVEPRVDRQKMRAAMAGAGRDAGAAFRTAFDRSLANQTDAWERFNRQRVQSFRRANLTMAREMGTSYQEAAHRMRDNHATTINVMRNENRRLTRSFDDEGRHSSRGFFGHMKQGFEGLMSVLPGRLETLFTKTGPVIGTALFGAIAAALIIGMPALGAMVGGLFVASLGLGALLGAAIVGAIKDPRVNEAAKRLADNFMNKIIFDKRVQHLGQVLANQLDKVNKALDRWAPHIQNILIAGGKFLPGITNGLIGMVDAVLPALDRLVNSPFMTDLMKIFGGGLKKIGEAFGVSFDRILDDPKAMEGMKKGLEDFFDLLAGTVKLVFDIIRQLSRWWEDMNKKGEDGESILDKMRNSWKNIRDMINEVLTFIKKIWVEIDTLVGPNSKMGELQESWKGMRDTAKDFYEILRATTTLLGGSNKQPGFTPQQQKQNQTGTGKNPYGNIGQGGKDFNGEGKGFGGGNWWQNQWDDMRGEAVIAWTTIQTKAKEFFSDLAGIFSPNSAANQAIKAGWNATWGWVKSQVAVHWNAIVSAVATGLTFLKNVWNTSWGWVKQRAVDTWNNIRAFIGTVWSIVCNWIVERFNMLRAAWNQQWAMVINIVKGTWNAIRTWIGSIWNIITNWVIEKFNQFRAMWNQAWAYVVQTVKGTWTAIRNFIGAVWNTVTAWVMEKLRQLGSLWNQAWGWISTKVREIWNAISATIRSRFNDIVKFISDTYGKIKTGWNNFWRGIGSTVAKTWSDIRGAVHNGIKWMIDTINKGIKLVNTVLKKLHIPWEIPTIPGMGSAPSGGGAPTTGNRGGLQRAKGGPIDGPGSSTSDSIPARLSKGEHVWTAAEVKAVGGHKAMLSMRNAAAGGKLLPGEGGVRDMANNQLMNEHRDHVHVAMQQGVSYILAMAKRQFGARTPPATSTFRPGDPKLHGQGKAVDFGGFNQDAFASFWMGKPGLMELIHRTATRDYGVYLGGGGTGGGGGLFGGIFDWVRKGWAKFKEMIGGGIGKAANLFGNPDHLPGQLGKGITKQMGEKIIAKAKGDFDKAKKEMEAAASSSGSMGSTEVATQALSTAKGMGANGRVILALFEAGLVESGMRNLNYGDRDSVGFLQQRPSQGWPNPRHVPTATRSFVSRAKSAGNMGSAGALAQAVQRSAFPGRYNARKGDAMNLLKSLGYSGGYDYGGVLQPGAMGVNMGRKPEMVLSPGQGQALEDRISGSGDTYATIKIGDEIIANRVKLQVERNNELIIADLNRGY